MGQLGGSIASAVGSGGSVLGGIGGNMLNKNVVDPSQANWADLDTSEKLARFGAQGLRGAANGMQNYYGQAGQLQNRGGGMSPMQIPQTPAIQPTIFNPQGPSAANNGGVWPPDGGPTKRGSNPYFYGYGQ